MSKVVRGRCKISFAVIVLAALWAVVAICSPRSVSAQSAGEIRVKITNGTPDGGPVGGLPMSVLVVQNSQQEIVTQDHADTNGSYVASNLSAPQGASYVISTTYEGVPYETAPISLPAQDVRLSVYETTADDTKIRISNAGIVVLEVDPETQILRFLETVTLLNSGDRTFLPSTTGARGPMGLLRFGLPSGAGNLIVGEGLTNSTVIQVDTGFATDLPVPPGETNVSYAYDMAYGALPEGGYALVSRNVTYPIDTLRVLALQGSARLESSLLTDNGIVTVGSHSYRQFGASDLPANSDVSFELRDLPLIQPVLRPGNPWLQGVVAVLSLVALLLPILYRRRYLRLRQHQPAQADASLRSAIASAPSTAAAASQNSTPASGYPRTQNSSVRRIASRPPTGKEPHP